MVRASYATKVSGSSVRAGLLLAPSCTSLEDIGRYSNPVPQSSRSFAAMGYPTTGAALLGIRAIGHTRSMYFASARLGREQCRR